MSSRNKKNKLKNSYNAPSVLKGKLCDKAKGSAFYTSSTRQDLKGQLRRIMDDE